MLILYYIPLKFNLDIFLFTDNVEPKKLHYIRGYKALLIILGIDL